MNFLEDIMFMLVKFSNDISYYNRPVTELICNFNKNEKNIDFVNACSLMLNSEIDFPEAWEASIKNHCRFLNKEEKRKLIEYGKSIGKTDTQGHKEIFNTYYGYFENYKNTALCEFNKYNRTVIASFFFLGCGLFILLI